MKCDHLPKKIYNFFTICYWCFIIKDDFSNVNNTRYGRAVGTTRVEASIKQLPDILWDISNPIFNETTCGVNANRIYVREMFQLNIICANPALNSAVLSSETVDQTTLSMNQDNLYFYNILVTEDETTFRNRINNKDNTTVLKHCRLMTQQKQRGSGGGVTSYIIDSYTVRFDPWANYRKYTFKSGHVYYFYTTSNGSVESLTSEQGTVESHPMSLIVHVCDNDQDSGEIPSKCKPSNMASSYLSMCGNKLKPSLNEAFSTDDEQQGGYEIVNVSIAGFVVLILISFVCGVLLGLVVRRILVTWEKKRTES